jgi:nicotinic acid mononucleotide adenylyltransferase
MTLPRPSYTINTLRHLAELRPGVEFSLLMGGDNAEGIASWREASAILGHYPVYVYPRPGDDEARFPAGVTVLEDAPRMEVSSTEVRALLAEGRRLYGAGELGAAATAFIRARELSPWSAEAAGYLEMIEDIQSYRNTDILNP